MHTMVHPALHVVSSNAAGPIAKAVCAAHAQPQGVLAVPSRHAPSAAAPAQHARPIDSVTTPVNAARPHHSVSPSAAGNVRSFIAAQHTTIKMLTMTCHKLHRQLAQNKLQNEKLRCALKAFAPDR